MPPLLRRSIVCLLVVALASCGGPRLTRKLSPDLRAVDAKAPFLKAHLKNGDVVIFQGWTLDEPTSTVSGAGQRLGPDRSQLAVGPQRVALADVAIFETNVVEQPSRIAAMAVITGISAAVTIACLLNPKACFGSCPTFYASDGRRPVLQAEGFSDSVSPVLEATDVDALYLTTSETRTVDVRMTNEALETHVVKAVNLLAVPRPDGPGGRVFAAGDGSYWQATEVATPLACTAPEGDCLAQVRTVDGVERFSTTDPVDLATREELELELAPSPAGARTGLVLGTRQTLVSTFVLYQGLAYMGARVGRWLSALETGDRALLERARSFLRVLGGIEVLVEDAAGTWQVVGEISETGPLARDVHVIPLPPGVPAPRRIRLRLARGHWRLDYLALATLGTTVAPIRVAPSRIEGTMSREFAPARTPATAFPVITLPGDAYALSYELPEHPERYELFLESRGYYLEWMRTEWIAEEDQVRALQLLADPAAALKSLAPVFKAREAEFEAAFWGSRYAHE